MNRLLLIGLNHTTAPLAVRERLAFSSERAREALATFRERFPGLEGVLLSTCNRVEFYISADSDADDRGQAIARDVMNFLARFHDVSLDLFASHIYAKRGRDMIEHAFAVAASLDSLVLGETQILGQVREAYDAARVAGTTGAMLNPLFQRALFTGKEVQTNTALGDGRLSVASVAVDYAKRIFETFNDKTVLSIGAGKMGGLLLSQFAALRSGRLLICNRDRGKAEMLAKGFHGEAIPFEALGEQLALADIVCSSTGASRPIITTAQVRKALRSRRYRPMFLLDIAVPRDVDEAVAELDQVYLYNIDDLQQVVSATQSQRTDALDAARAIVRRQVEEFITWQSRREMGPAIDSLYRRYHELARTEVERAIASDPSLDEAQRSQMEEMARRIVNKLLHDPVRALRVAESQHAASSAQYVHALQKLFDLDGAGVRQALQNEPSLWPAGQSTPPPVNND